MSCDLKTTYRPDKRLQKRLVGLAYSLIALSFLVIIFFLFPEYFIYWGIAAVLLILNSIFLAVKALEAGENAIMYGGFANEVIATDKKIKRIDDASGNSVIYNAKSAELFGEGNVIDFLEDNIANDEVNKNALQRLKKAAENFLEEEVDIAIEQSTEKFTSLKNVEYYRISIRPIFLNKVDFFQSPLILRKIRKDSFILWSAINITATKNIEHILNQERKDLHDFLDYLPVGLYVLDDNQKIDYVNLRFAEWIGKAREEIIGKSFIDLLVINSNQPLIDKEWAGEVHFKDNDKFFNAFVAHSLYDDEGDIKTRAVVIRDVANAKEVKDDLIAANDKISWLFDNSPVGIVNVCKTGKIFECNDIFENYFNQKKDDLLEKEIYSLIKENDKNLLREKLDAVYSGKDSSQRIDVHLNSDNELDDKVATIHISPMIKKLSVDGEDCDGLILHFIDATKQKSLELQFAQAQKMQAMGQLAGGVAHDFNNLLTAMIGFCDLLLQRHGIGDPSFADLIQIKNNANRAAGLVRQLLAFSRKQSLQPKLIDVTENFAEITHLLKRVIGERVELKYQHGNDLGFIRVDPVQFSQVILNLAVNAKDAMENSGILTIKTYQETLKDEVEFGGDIIKPGEFLVIDVTDTGCGIPEENLTRIFEPFFSTKQNVVGSGTGLGLATVYGIVRQTGGYINVDSKLGEGTTFSIRLPRFENDEDVNVIDNEIKNDEVISNNKGATVLSVKEKFAVSTGGSKEQLTFGLNVNDFTRISPTSSSAVDGVVRVLFVEDEDSVRAFGIRALKKKGYDVIGCNSAENAIEHLEEDKDFNLLITDMVMPGKNGAELAKYVKEAIPDINIILMSGYSEDIAKNELAVSDDYEFMAKPFSLGSLIAKVQEVLK